MTAAKLLSVALGTRVSEHRGGSLVRPAGLPCTLSGDGRPEPLAGPSASPLLWRAGGEGHRGHGLPCSRPRGWSVTTNPRAGLRDSRAPLSCFAGWSVFRVFSYLLLFCAVGSCSSSFPGMARSGSLGAADVT